MSWRTVIISSRCKLDLKMGYLVDSDLQTHDFYPLAGFCSVGEKVPHREVTVGALLKSVGITLRDDYPDALERLLDYMELVRRYERNKLFIFVNLRSYFPDDSVQRFLQTAIDHQYTLLLVDAWEHPRLPEERRLIIDKDLCEI